MAKHIPVEYLLPLRWDDDADLDELVEYVRWLSARVDVTVVDASPPELFAGHHARLREVARHLPPDPTLDFANGKVNGVHTGMCLARHEHVVIADDDVRFDDAALWTVHRLLDRFDLVRPQNYFDPLPWHARWDTARSLLNRAVVGADYPGTLAVRRSTYRRVGGYDGNVLFENLELIRTVRAGGGVEVRPLGLYVRRLPPRTRRFLGQRVRQAYDDLAQPVRMALFLALLPATVTVVAVGRPEWVAAGAVTVGALAESGRRRAGGTAVFPVSTSLFAPLWALERGFCSWLALWRLARGGVRYHGRRLRIAAHAPGELARRIRDGRARGPGAAVPGSPVGSSAGSPVGLSGGSSVGLSGGSSVGLSGGSPGASSAGLSVGGRVGDAVVGR